jgi:hypothetical protein
MNSAAWLWRIVDWGSIPIMAIVIGILAWRKLHREFPFFFTYLLASEATTALRFFTVDRGETYFYVYWISEIAICGFSLLVVFELFALRLFPKFYKIRFYRYLFIVIAAIIALGAWLTAMESGNKYTVLIIQSRVFYFVIVGMLTFFVSLMMVMGREWTQYEFAISVGFVITNAGAFFVSVLLARAQHQGIVQEIAPITFDIACLLWLYCFWSKERVFNRRGTSTLQPEMVEEARRWQAVLKESILSKKRTP